MKKSLLVYCLMTMMTSCMGHVVVWTPKDFFTLSIVGILIVCLVIYIIKCFIDDRIKQRKKRRELKNKKNNDNS
jgi:UDP-N-acetylmuramyl pentapeptide phosphotransferase/UDP-N-acetylglucosamine-1-phosphate transferase